MKRGVHANGEHVLDAKAFKSRAHPRIVPSCVYKILVPSLFDKEEE